ncbi:MAG: M28 family peptidase [Prevotellaceae bacterium]|jgi:Zn-dependent M28 family amino/carboxypeptidase|nr:M28 family peptidase [Prevotellaceae bacterium]
MKTSFTIAFLSFFANVFAQQSELPNFAASILESDLQQHIRVLAADSMQGRQTGTDAAFMAADYIAGQFEKISLYKPYDSTYFQAFITSTPGVNVVGVIEGSDLKEEALVISAHYDHLGVFNGNVYNGADDNASGVAAMLEIAEAFTAMARNHYPPRRSVVFIAFDAKEQKMAGSAYYVNDPLYPLQRTIANLNIDAVGRVEGSPNGQRNYLFLVGANRVSSDLQDISDYVNQARKINLTLDYTFYNSPTFSEIFYLFSDQYNFGKHQLPVIYYMDGLHDDLNKPTDTEDYIDYKILRDRTQLIFYTAWELANRDGMLKKDLIKRKNNSR